MKILGEDCNPRLLDDEFNLWIIRHSRVDSRGALYGGGLDFDTMDIHKYESEFEWLAKRLRRLPKENTVFYTSEQKRSIQTFNELAKHMNISDQFRTSLKELNEQNFGCLEGYSFEYLCELANGGWKELYALVKANNVAEIHKHLRSEIGESLRYRGKAAHIPGWKTLQDSIDNGAPLCEDVRSFHHSSRYFFRQLRLHVKYWEDQHETKINHVVVVSHRCRIRGLLAAATPNFGDRTATPGLPTFEKALEVYENIAIDNLSLTRLTITDGLIDKPIQAYLTEINSTRSDK